MSKLKPCSVSGCCGIARTRGLCPEHYKRRKTLRGLRPDEPTKSLANKRFWKRMLERIYA